MPVRLCSIEGCEKRHLAQGRCSSHYGTFRYATDPEYRAKAKARAARRRIEHPEKIAAYNAIYQAKRRSDPAHRRRRTIYLMWWHHNRKVEAYVRSGLVNEGLTRRNDGEESSPRTGGAA